jgi:hypothetical protein
VSAPEKAPETLACPQCPVTVALDPDDPDDDLQAFWVHLGTHAPGKLRRLRLWTAATGAGP